MIELKLHNIIVTVGPSMSGKTFWTTELKRQLDEHYNLNVQIVSSDDLRRELLGEDLDRYHPKMVEVSNHAFDLLYKKVELLSSWPTNAEIIIVDTTGLGERFRQDILKIAKDNYYNTTVAVFDYKDNSDYFRFGGSGVTRKHVNKLREVHKTLNRFQNRIVIKSPDDPIEVSIPDYDYYRSHFLSGDYTIVGDLHGSWQALEKLTGNLIFVGDIVDKGPLEDVIKTIDLVHAKVSEGSKFVIGNHDDWAVKYWQGFISHTREIAEQYFQNALDLPVESQIKLQELVNTGRYFYRTPYEIITHAPCPQKYLGKLHTTGQQKVYRYPKLNDYPTKQEYQAAIYNAFDFLKEEEQWGYPAHVWGHVALAKPFRNQCNLGIDTGAIHGNGLTYVIKGRFETIPTEKLAEGELLNIRRPKPVIGLDELEPRTKGKILWMARNKVNFISGTMSPSDVHDNDLESLRWAVDYYGRCVVQPKYMGSRGNVYLTSDPTTSYCITRGGFLLRENERLHSEYARLIARFQTDFDAGLQVRVLDCEILPWRLMGADLIDKSFYGLGELVRNQLLEIKDLPLDQLKTYFTGLQIDETSKAEVIKQYGHHVWSTYLAWKSLNIDLDVSNVDRFLEQTNLYGQDGDPEIKPFTILKDVYGNEEILYDNHSNATLWEYVNDDPILVSSDYDEILNFWNSLVFEQGYEGIVIKPELQTQGDKSPYLKVRNEQYLTLCYGPDYKNSNKYAKLIRRKNITRKLRLSIEDWNRGWKILAVPYNELAEDNSELINLYISHVITEEKSKELDPRL